MRVFTVLGPSNSGKSTLVQALVGLDDRRGKSLAVQGVATVSTFGFMGQDWAAIDIVGGADLVDLSVAESGQELRGREGVKGGKGEGEEDWRRRLFGEMEAAREMLEEVIGD